MKLLHLSRKAETSIGDLVTLLEMDPVLTADILRVAQSAAFSTGSEPKVDAVRTGPVSWPSRLPPLGLQRCCTAQLVCDFINEVTRTVRCPPFGLTHEVHGAEFHRSQSGCTAFVGQSRYHNDWQREMRLADAVTKLQAHQAEWRALDVRTLSIFGSTARDEARPDSDIDLLVDFNGPVTLEGYMLLKIYFEQLLHTRVDLVTSGGIKPRLKKTIDREAVLVA